MVYFGQNKLLYVPNMPSVEMKFPEANPLGFRSPEEHNLDFEDARVTTSDGYTLYGWFVKQVDPQKVETLIFFHANAGNIGFRLPNIVKLHEHCDANILIVGYRGYGHSEGTPTEEGLKLDSEAILDWALKHPDIDNNKIFVFGRSLGGAVAIHLCSRRPENIQGLILENTFSCISDMVDRIFPYVSVLKRYLLEIDWNSIESIKTIKTPMLFISGRKDQIVPFEQMDRLYDAAKEARHKDMYKIENGTHNE